jgi:hypothetical protein
MTQNYTSDTYWTLQLRYRCCLDVKEEVNDDWTNAENGKRKEKLRPIACSYHSCKI